MARASFDESLKRLLAHEGGYSNHPSDPGGPTNFGITLADYRKYIDVRAGADDVRRMSINQAKAIYKSRYWDAMRCDELPAGVDYCVFDYGVNSGTGRAPKVLKRLLGLDARNSAVTPEVIAAASRREAKVLVNDICDERLRFLRGLRTWPVFGNGWARRVREVRVAALAIAEGAAVAAAHDRAASSPASALRPSPSVPGKGHVPVNGAAQTATAAGAGVGGAVLAAQTNDPTVVLAVFALTAAVVIGGFWFWRWWQQRRQDAAA